jgi:hypothetical protein
MRLTTPLLRQHDLAVEVEGDVRALRERIRYGLGPTQPAEMEAALEQVSEKARRIVTLSASQQLPELATGTSTHCQPYEASSPDLQTGCSAWQDVSEPLTNPGNGPGGRPKSTRTKRVPARLRD